jgi:hypothetical protein
MSELQPEMYDSYSSDLAANPPDKDTEVITVIKGEHFTIMTNGPTGGWVKQKNGSLISIEAAKSMNRKKRRELGIKI